MGRLLCSRAFALILAACMMIACTRKAVDSEKTNFRLQVDESLATKIAQVATPPGVLNCFAAFISYADSNDGLVAGSCKDGSELVSSPKVAFGAVTTGGELSGAVTSGPSRKIQLVHFQTEASTCPSIKDLKLTDMSMITAPLVIVAETTMTISGASQTILLTAGSTIADKFLCTGGPFNWELPPSAPATCSGTETAYNAHGTGTLADPFILCTPAQIVDLSVNGCGAIGNADCDKSFRQDALIDMTSIAFTPIGSSSYPFTGTYDGAYYRIDYLTVAKPTPGTGFFAYTNGATLKAMDFGFADITGGDSTGVVVGDATNTTFDDIYVQGQIHQFYGTSGSIGMITGSDSGGTYIEPYTVGNIIIDTNAGAGNSVGGIVGLASTTTIDEGAAGVHIDLDPSNTGDGVGGLVGVMVSGSINGSHASGFVEGQIAGGLAGRISSTNIFDSYATGNVTGMGTASMVGGLIGKSVGATQERNYATGAAIASSGANGMAGGYIGRVESSTVKNSYATGNVTGSSSDWAGGFAAYAFDLGVSTTFINCYARNSVTGPYIGGFVGGAAGSPGSTFTNNYWDNSIGPAAGQGGGTQSGQTGLTSAQMTNAANFPAWDFTNIWIMGANGPELQ